MRIVNWETLAAMPEDTLYHDHYQCSSSGPLRIKGKTEGDLFRYSELSNAALRRDDHCRSGREPEEYGAEYAVWEQADVLKLIMLLGKCAGVSFLAGTPAAGETVCGERAREMVCAGVSRDLEE